VRVHDLADGLIVEPVRGPTCIVRRLRGGRPGPDIGVAPGTGAISWLRRHHRPGGTGVSGAGGHNEAEQRGDTQLAEPPMIGHVGSLVADPGATYDVFPNRHPRGKAAGISAQGTAPSCPPSGTSSWRRS
jgi:hypothetical protein